MKGYTIINSVLNEQFGERMGGPHRAGPVGKCICPNCKTITEKIRGVPCTQTKCPKCGTLMVRQLSVRK